MTDNIIKDWLSAELQKVHSVVVYINPGISGVKAPVSLTSKPSFTLLLSNHFDRPLIFRKNDFKSDFLFDNGFEGCTIPWKAIWAAHPENEVQKIIFWNENSPGSGWDKALVEYLEAEQKPKAPILEVAKNLAPLPESIETTTASEVEVKVPLTKSSKLFRSHLKLVK